MIGRQYARLYVKDVADKGRSVFTQEFTRQGTVVETCPVLLIKPEEMDLFAESLSLSDYLFEWSGRNLALALGYGSLYNHCDDPNLADERDFERGLMIFRARRNIQAHEELTIRYRVVWFPVRP